MKKALYLFILVSCAYHAHSQEKSVLLAGGARDFMVVNPNTNTLFGKHSDGDIRPTQIHAFFAMTILEKGRLQWDAGVCWRKTTYRYTDRIRSVDYYEPLQPLQHYEYTDPADYVAASNTFGIRNEVSYRLKETPKLVHCIGLVNETYLAEWFSAKYESDDDFELNDGNGYYSPYEPPLYADAYENPHYFLSASSLSAFYRVRLNLKNFPIRPSLQVSVGTNLYADWNQFSKCLWIGFGGNLELIRSKKE